MHHHPDQPGNNEGPAAAAADTQRMITIRRSEVRGHIDNGWLNTYHTFSFASYYDPAHMGFRALRVLNDDRVATGKGFGAHAHRDMEILTYVLDGRLGHRDSMGRERVIGANTVQAISAGTGVIHREFNASEKRPVHFLQIWIEPAVRDVDPSYQQIPSDPDEKRGRFGVVASPRSQGGDGTPALIHQDTFIYVAELDAGDVLKQHLKTSRYAWVQVARGSISLNGEALEEGDGAACSGESDLAFAGARRQRRRVSTFRLGLIMPAENILVTFWSRTGKDGKILPGQSQW